MDKPEGPKCPNSQGRETGETSPPLEQLKAPPRPPDSERWREVAAQAAAETDPNRLTQLVDELIRLLDEGRASKSKPRDPSC
jgi:hypothetical protein